jgi:GAF domain-containing protein
VLCLSRREPLRVVSELDLEIAQALAEQIALAISAASAFSALNHLEQRLGCLPPAHA